MKKFRSLSTVLKAQILLALTVGVFVIAGTVSYQQYQSAHASLSNKAKTTLNMTSKSISDPVWNFNEDGIADFSKALLEDTDVHYYELLDAKDKSLFRTAKDGSEKTFAEVCAGGNFICESKEIKREADVIGKINVAFSLDVIKKAVIASLSLMVGLGLGVIIFLALLISSIVRKLVKLPLDVLGGGASELSQGNLDYEFKITQNNEIGTLANQFTSMRDAIKSKIADLKRLNELGQKISQITDPDTIRDLVAKASKDKLRVDAIGFYSMSSDKAKLSLDKSFGGTNSLACPASFNAGDAGIGKALETHGIQTANVDGQFRAYMPIVNEEGICFGFFVAVSAEEIKVSGTESSFLETLTRTAATRLENLAMVQTIEDHNRNLEKTVQLRTADLAKALDVVNVQKNQIAAIVDNVQFGLLRANRAGEIQEGYSRSCNSLLAPGAVGTLAGKKIWDLLALTDRSEEHFRNMYEQVFDVPMLADELVSEIPEHHVVTDRNIALQCYPIMMNDETESVLFCMADVTVTKKMEKENDKNKTLIRIVQNKDRFRSLLTEIYATDDQMMTPSIVGPATKAKNSGKVIDMSEVKRTVHTWKGDLATFGLAEVAGFLHSVEDTLGMAAPERDEFVKSLKNMLQEFLASHYDVLKISPDRINDNTVNLELAAVTGLLDSISRSSKIEDARSLVAQFVRESTMDRGEVVLNYLSIATREVAKRLEKDIQVETKGAKVRIPNEFRDVISSLIHIVRNAVDHGVEEPLKRGNKTQKATVCIDISETSDEYKVQISDDGRGIDLEKLKASMIKKSLMTEENWSKLTEDERLRLIFASNVSTKDTITEISGRGVGLNSVVSNVESVGGSIQVTSKVGEGTVFVIHLPRVPHVLSVAC